MEMECTFSFNLDPRKKKKKKKKAFSDSIIGSGYDLTSSKARIVDKYGIIAPLLLRLNLYQPFFLAKVW